MVVEYSRAYAKHLHNTQQVMPKYICSAKTLIQQWQIYGLRRSDSLLLTIKNSAGGALLDATGIYATECKFIFQRDGLTLVKGAQRHEQLFAVNMHTPSIILTKLRYRGFHRLDPNSHRLDCDVTALHYYLTPFVCRERTRSTRRFYVRKGASALFILPSSPFTSSR